MVGRGKLGGFAIFPMISCTSLRFPKVLLPNPRALRFPVTPSPWEPIILATFLFDWSTSLTERGCNNSFIFTPGSRLRWYYVQITTKQFLTICFPALHRSRLLLCLVPCVVMMLTLQHSLSTSAKLQMICNIPVVAWRKILANPLGLGPWRKLPSNHGTKRQWFFHSSHLFWKNGPTFSWAMKKTGCLGYVGDLLPSYIGIIRIPFKQPV